MTPERPPIAASLALTLAPLLAFSGRPGTENLLLAASLGLLLAHLHVALRHPPSSRLRLLRPIALLYTLSMAPAYGVPLVIGGFLFIATILRLLDGSHFRDPRGSLLLSLVTLALAILGRQSSLILLYLIVYLIAAEIFLLRASLSATGARLVARSDLARPFLAAARARLPAALLVATALFLLVPRVTLGFFLFRGGMPAFTGQGIHLDEMEDLRLSNDVMMRVQLSRPANVYYRGRSFNIYSPNTRRWHAMPIRRRASGASEGATAIPRFVDGDWRIPDKGETLAQEYWLSAHLFGAFFSVYAPASTDYPAGGFETDDLENARPFRSAVGLAHYKVESRLPAPASDALRTLKAPPEGPTVLAYLQVPRQLTRLRALARRVAGHLPTVLDRALAIENHLRTEYEYTLTLSKYRRRTAHGDPIEAFLFDHKSGHCELFASAMVLMCREVGVPARLTEGFAGGEYVEGDDYYIVRGRDAHAWVEVYFHGEGWYAFDPTGFRAAASDSSGAFAALGRLADRIDFFFDRFVTGHDPTLLADAAKALLARARDLARAAARSAPERSGPRLALHAAALLAAALLALLLLVRFGGGGLAGRIAPLRALRRRLLAAHPALAARAGYGADDFHAFLVDEAAGRGLARRRHETPRAFAARVAPHLARDAREAHARVAARHGDLAYRERPLLPEERSDAWTDARRAADRMPDLR